MVLGLSDAVLFGILELPLHGRGKLLDLAGLLFILSCQFLGVPLAPLLKPTRDF
jgi:ABC-2 type transport system permease protein